MKSKKGEFFLSLQLYVWCIIRKKKKLIQQQFLVFSYNKYFIPPMYGHIIMVCPRLWQLTVVLIYLPKIKAHQYCDCQNVKLDPSGNLNPTGNPCERQLLSLIPYTCTWTHISKSADVNYTGQYTEFPNLLFTLFWCNILLHMGATLTNTKKR